MFSRGLNEIAVNMVETRLSKKTKNTQNLARSPSLDVTHDVKSQET